jgi:nicotinamidase/pyrazinamidase
MQYDFLPGGSLAVENGDAIIPGINQAIDLFHGQGLHVIFTQDWHPANHASFASQHEGKEPGDPIEDPSGKIGPILWPDHCVQGTMGARIHHDMHLDKGTLVIRKGYHADIDSYSTFLENDKKTPTGLAGYCKELGIERVFTCGLALDYCVYHSAMDARDFGFQVMYLIDLAKPVGSPEGIVERVLSKMTEKSVEFTNLKNLRAFQ